MIWRRERSVLRTDLAEWSDRKIEVVDKKQKRKTLFSYDYVQNIAQPLILCLNRINVKLKE